MSKPAWLDRLFTAIDGRDAETFGSFLHNNVVFRFGNNPEVHGRGPTVEIVGQFFGALAGIRHEIYDVWETGGAVIVHGQATYTRQSGTKLTVPFANVFKMKENLIKDYLIYIDNSRLFAEG